MRWLTRLRWWLRQKRLQRAWAVQDALTVTLPRMPDFDWLAEYGPYWKPGSTAFWLEPRTDEQLRAWVMRYQLGGFDVEIEPAIPDVAKLVYRKPTYPQNALQQMQAAQYHSLLANSRYAGYQNGLLNAYNRQVGLGQAGSLFGGLL